MHSLTNFIIGGGLMGIVALLTWVTTSRATRAQARTDSLAKASVVWESIGDTLGEQIERMDDRLTTLEETNVRLAEENRRFHSALGDLFRWLREWSAWEAAGSPPPPPYSVAQILARLENLLGDLAPKNGEKND